MTCERIEEHLSELIDNELDPGCLDTRTAKEVNRHLVTCASCRQEFEELRLIVRQSAALEPLEPPDRLYWTIRNRARSARPKPWFTPQKVGWVLVPALATAALMLMVFPRKHSDARPASDTYASSALAHTDSGVPLSVIPEATPRMPSREGQGFEDSRVQARTPEPRGPGTPGKSVMAVAAVQPVAAPIVTVRPQTNSEVIASLRNVQQALEEIEAALQQNPGNVQVQVAYRVTYQKGMELRQRYVVGAR